MGYYHKPWATWTDGWALTENGVRWLQKQAPRFEHLGQDRVLRDHRQKVLKELRRVFEHNLWKTYLIDPGTFEPSIGELADLLRCRVDAPQHVWAGRFEELARKAVAFERNDLSNFTRECRQAYEASR